MLALTPSRRDVLRSLIAAAGLPAAASAVPSPRRVGIIGAGMAGVSLAWLLDGSREVVLIESRGELGGNVRTVELEVDGQKHLPDVGAQYFHPAAYPVYVKLLEYLGLYPSAAHSFPASITVDAASEATPRFVSPILPGRGWPIVAGWNWSALQAFSVAFSAAKTREQRDGRWGVTMQDWLATLGLSAAQREGMLLPCSPSCTTC